MATTKRRYSKEEFSRRGDALIKSNVRPKLAEADWDKFVAIDIETGEYEVDKNEMKAVDRFRKRVPDSQIWLVHATLGYLHRLGSRQHQPALAGLLGLPPALAGGVHRTHGIVEPALAGLLGPGFSRFGREARAKATRREARLKPADKQRHAMDHQLKLVAGGQSRLKSALSSPLAQRCTPHSQLQRDSDHP